MKRRSSITAAELAAKLQANPEYVRKRAERERQLANKSAAFREEERPVLDDLRRLGLRIASVADLINSDIKYDEAIPTLVQHLSRPYSERLRETLARALATPAAKDAWQTLVMEYRKAPAVTGRASVKDGLAVALAATCTEATMPELVSLVTDRSHGASRLLLLSALRRSRSELAKRTLDELRADPDLAEELASWRR